MNNFARLTLALLCALFYMTLIAAAANATPGAFGFEGIRRHHGLSSPVPPPFELGSKTAVESRLRDFGLAVVEADRETIRELAPFSSLITIAWDHPELAELSAYARSYGMKVLLPIHGLFFISSDVPGVPWPIWSLRPDYTDR